MEGNPSALQQRFYDEHHSDSLVHRANRRRTQIAVKLLASIPTGKLLDIGCSDESLTEMFRPFELHGIDISPQAVREARIKGIDARCADIADGLPFNDASFDVVFAGETLEHTVRTDFFLCECTAFCTLTVPSLTMPNVNSVASWSTTSMLNLPPYASARYRSPHVRDFTTRLLKLALRNNGFATIKIHGTWLGLPWPAAVEWFFGPVEAALAYGLPRIAAGSHL